MSNEGQTPQDGRVHVTSVLQSTYSEQTTDKFATRGIFLQRCCLMFTDCNNSFTARKETDARMQLLFHTVMWFETVGLRTRPV